MTSCDLLGQIPLLGFGREQKKLPPRRIPTVGIVQKSPSTPPHQSHKHHHHGGAVCPSYGVVSMDTPDWTQVTYSKGVGPERLCGVLYKSIKNREINLSPQLLVFSMICSPAVKNGCQNGIHRQRRALKQYEKVHNNYKNNNLTQF